MSRRHEFRVLGPLEVWDGETSLPLGSARRRAVLATLVLHAGETVPSARLVEAVWGDAPPERAATPLRAHVTALRRLLEPERGGGESLLVAAGAGYRLCVDPDQVDSHRFERLAGEARQALDSDPATASALLRQACALWRGPALAGLDLASDADAERGRLDAMRATAVEDRIQADLELGRHAAVVADLEALVAAHPGRERLHALRMLALYRCGLEVDALAAFRQAQAHLDPSPELRSLERAIVERHPALAGPTAAPARTVTTTVIPALAAAAAPGRRPLALTGAAALLIAGGSAGGLGLHALQAGTPVPAHAAAPVDAFPTAPEQRLIGQFGTAVSDCHRHPIHDARALADVECTVAPGHPGARSLLLQSFATDADLEMHFHHVLGLTIPGETGRPLSAAYQGDCADPGSGFFALSDHRRAGAATANGHLMCYADHAGLPHLAWTDVNRLVVAQATGLPGPASEAQAGLLCFWHGLYPEESGPAPATAPQLTSARTPAPLAQVGQVTAPSQRQLAPTPSPTPGPRTGTPPRTGGTTTAAPAPATPAATPAAGGQHQHGDGWDGGWNALFGGHGHD